MGSGLSVCSFTELLLESQSRSGWSLTVDILMVALLLLLAKESLGRLHAQVMLKPKAATFSTIWLSLETPFLAQFAMTQLLSWKTRIQCLTESVRITTATRTRHLSLSLLLDSCIFVMEQDHISLVWRII